MSQFTGSTSYESTSIPPESAVSEIRTACRRKDLSYTTQTGSLDGSNEKSSTPTITIATTMSPGSRIAWFTQSPMIDTTDFSITISCPSESLGPEAVRAGDSALKRKQRFIDVSHEAANSGTFNMSRKRALSRARKAIDEETSRFEQSSVGEENTWYRRGWSVNGTNPRTKQLTPVQANSLLSSIHSMISRDRTGRSGRSNTLYESTAGKDATTAKSFVDTLHKTGTEPHMTGTKRWLGIRNR